MNDTEDYEGTTDMLNAVAYSMPRMKNWKVNSVYDYDSNIYDYENIENLNSAINRARNSLFQITERINDYERREKIAKTKYEREWRRAYLKSNEKTESAKKIRADLECEELEDNTIVYEQVRNELNRLSNAIRLELQTLQALGNNLRQQLKVE